MQQILNPIGSMGRGGSFSSNLRISIDFLCVKIRLVEPELSTVRETINRTKLTTKVDLLDSEESLYITARKF